MTIQNVECFDVWIEPISKSNALFFWDVIPAKAGIQPQKNKKENWVPAFAGTTELSRFIAELILR
jgi:hypothetical protein